MKFLKTFFYKKNSLFYELFYTFVVCNISPHKIEIEFLDEELAQYYEGNKVKNKELKSNSNLQNLFRKTIDRLKILENIEDLYRFNSLNYEKLTGNLQGKSSVRVNKKYRIIFEEKTDEFEKIIILLIEELSNHYQ